MERTDLFFLEFQFNRNWRGNVTESMMMRIDNLAKYLEFKYDKGRNISYSCQCHEFFYVSPRSAGSQQLHGGVA